MRRGPGRRGSGCPRPSARRPGRVPAPDRGPRGSVPRPGGDTWSASCAPHAMGSTPVDGAHLGVAVGNLAGLHLRRQLRQRPEHARRVAFEDVGLRVRGDQLVLGVAGHDHAIEDRDRRRDRSLELGHRVVGRLQAKRPRADHDHAVRGRDRGVVALPVADHVTRHHRELAARWIKRVRIDQRRVDPVRARGRRDQ